MRILSDVKRLARYASVPAVRRRGELVVAYIGWTGEGNLGDEAMYMAHRLAFPSNVRFAGMPIAPSNLILEKYASPRLDGICLGGGTLVGNGYFRAGLEAVQMARPDLPNFTLGVGCEDHTYKHGNRADIDLELGRWPRLLESFNPVRVRGPLSLETLSTIGCSGVVSADPAMFLPAFEMAPVDGRIGVNLGIVDDSWAGSGEPLPNIVASLLEQAEIAGREILLLPTTKDDYLMCRRHPALRSYACSDAALRNDVFRFLKDAGSCQVVLGMKLHSLVLASTQYVPSIALEYRPKCRDFMLSIGRHDRSMRLDEYNPAQLGDWLASDLRQRFSLSEELRARVTAQRTVLHGAATEDYQQLTAARSRFS